MSLASERREAELERANQAKAVAAMRKAGGTFSGGSQPGTFKTPDGKTVVGDAASGVYDMASLNRAALASPTGINVSVNGQPMQYVHPQYRDNPGLVWAGGDKAGGFMSTDAFNKAHPDDDGGIKQMAMLAALGLGGGIAAFGGLGGAAGGSGLLSAADTALIDAAGMGAGGNLGAAGGSLAGGAGGGGSLVANALGGAPGAGGGLSTLQGITAGGVTPWGAATSGLGVGAAGSAVGPIAQGLGDGGGSGIGTTFGIPNNVLGGLAQGIGGIAAGNAVGDAYSDVANQYLALGGPSRDRFNASFAPGFDLMQAEPGLQGALDTAANTSARALSTRFGNPADSPTAQAEMNKYLMGNVYLPQLNTYRSQNLTGGGLGVNVAGTGSMGEAGASGMGWEALGAGLNTALNPQPSLADLFKQYGLGGNQGGFNLNIGGLPFGRS